MGVSRRSFLLMGGAAATAAALSACGMIGRKIASDDIPKSLSIPPGADSKAVPVLRLLNRAGYGPRPGDLSAALALGLSGVLEAQLKPEAIDDQASDLLMQDLTYYSMPVGQLMDQDPQNSILELEMATLGRAIYSKRQLYESMVEFWSDHFNIDLRKKAPIMFALKIADDRDAIRPNALGKFPDLLRASAHSPAMLVYLDNEVNFKQRPNENYAREIMELHTLSLQAGYSQQDVHELARILTGWRLSTQGLQQGQFFFDKNQHDFGQKTFLGQTFPAGRGEAEVLDALSMLANHPSTAEFIAAKLVRHFVADAPPTALVAQVADTYRSTGGDIKAMLRTIFASDEFASAPPRLKRPYAFAISALRALHADVAVQAYPQLLTNWLPRLGQVPFHWPTPDGYPDVSAKWAANLLPRWNFSLALLAGRISGVSIPLARLMQAGGVTDAQSAVEFFGGLVFNRPLSDAERALFGAYVGRGQLDRPDTLQRLKEAIALMLASPAFQWT